MFASLRTRLLQRAFNVLYARAAGVHEVAGRALFGPAWSARRDDVVGTLPLGLTLDIGCGDGRLMQTLTERGYPAVGLEPSSQMVNRTSKRGCRVVRGVAQAMPFRRSVFLNVVATYPGPWILDAVTWDEIARVMRPGASVRILLGGSTERGPGSGLRRIMQRIAYGAQRNGRSVLDLPVLGNAAVVGDYRTVRDRWGEAWCWCGTRVD
jgi:SAM-dependent methyltransferase